MIDAFGRYSPFHLEFVRSAEALVAVLKVNFKHHGNSAEKIEKGEFAIEDAATTRVIDLNTNWELCFSPGQRVEMSIVVTMSTLSLMNFARYERKKFAIYQNVRFRLDDRRDFASAERRYGQPWAKPEMRKCKLCARFFWTSENHKIHEKGLKNCTKAWIPRLKRMRRRPVKRGYILRRDPIGPFRYGK